MRLKALLTIALIMMFLMNVATIAFSGALLAKETGYIQELDNPSANSDRTSYPVGLRDNSQFSNSKMQSARTETQTPNIFSLGSFGKDLSSHKADEWSNIAYVDEDSAELVIGVNYAQPDGYTKVTDLIVENGGKLVNTVSIRDEVIALVADMPLGAVSSFVAQVQASGLARYVEHNMKFQTQFIPNDSNWSLQWGPQVIEADWAWNTTIGDPSILVAVIDTGVDYDHPDLAANYVPLGYDWVNNDTYPMDDEGHGTHCAGTIAAVINNGIGIAGLAQVQIMAEKGLDWGGGGYEDDLANAIIHAVDQGADILSNSWGGYGMSLLIYDAVKYAYDNGVLVVAAAGSDATSVEYYPAAFDEVVAVTATDEFDDPAWLTNYGEWVEVAAPGVDIYSTYLNDTYTYMNGTSMSTSHVAGVATLIWSQFPNMTRDRLRAQLQYTADDLGDPGFDQYYGYGRINARRAVEELDARADLKITDVYWEPSWPMPGDDVTFYAAVENQGTEDATDFDVELYLDGELLAWDTFSLAAGENDTYWNTDPWTATFGNHTVRWVIDATNVIDESNEDNNEMSDTFIVGAEEIYYDDGTAEWEYAWPAAGGMFAVRFTPATSGQLIECSFYISSAPANFKVHVLDTDKNDMITPVSVTPASTGWFHVDLSTYGITVNSGVDFYVAMESTVAEAPWLGADESDPDGRSWDYDGESWSQWWDDDYMIRAVIEYITQYYLTVDSPYGTPSGEGWYDTDTTAYATLDTGIVDHKNGTRRVFTHWSGDASGTNYAQSNPIYMDGPKTATANWETQYLVTFAHTGLDATATGTVLTVNGDTFSDLQYTTWVDSGDSISYSYSDQVSSSVGGKRFKLVDVTGPASPITVTGPVTVTGNYKTQYQVTFGQSGVEADFTGSVVTIDGNGYDVTDLAVSFWWDAGSSHDFAFQSPLVVTPDDKRYIWISTSGLSSLQSDSITVSTSGNINGDYKTQYYLTMNTNFGTVNPGSSWYDAGSTAQISAHAPDVVDGERYVWLGWTGTGDGSHRSTDNPASITMNGPINETATWRHEYYLTVTSLYGSPTPESGWFEAGEPITVSVTSPESGLVGTQYVCTGWTGTGSVSTSGTTTSAAFTIDEPSSITWNWETRSPLTLEIVALCIGSFSVVATVIAFFATRRKRGRVKKLLNDIDSAFFNFKMKTRRCEAELYRLRDIVLEDYKNGKITEQSYDILNERIDDYLKKL